MASEIEADVPCNMKLVERSYYTEQGWRLATFQEATDNLEMIKQHGLLHQWDRARLLDGWISGPGYDFQRGDYFIGCLGHMLIISVQQSARYSSGNSDTAGCIYKDVTLTDKGREVALLLCAQDWNYEVVYWLFNLWEERELFNFLDVRGGNIPFSSKTTFVEMNRVICQTSRILGEKRFASEKAMRNLSPESVKEVLVSMGKSCWGEFSQDDQKILGKTFLRDIERWSRHVSGVMEYSNEVNWFQEIAPQGDTSDDIWNFLWHNISSFTLAGMVIKSLCLLIEEWMNEGCQTGSRRDFIMSTAILYHLSDYEVNETLNIFKQACRDAADDQRQRFIDTLRKTSLAYCDKTGNHDVLNQILSYAARKGVSSVVKKVLEWGAQPGADPFVLGSAIDIDSKETVRSLFDKCDSKKEFANAVINDGKTALHWACTTTPRRPDVSIFRMLVEYGGSLDVPDGLGRLPLHYAVKGGREDIVDELIGEGNSNIVQSQDLAKMVTWEDGYGVSPLDMAVEKNNIKLMMKLLSISQQALDTYIDKVDSAKLLREFASQGNIEVVNKLLKSGADPLACDEQGQTALHYASMCEDSGKARELTESMLEKYTSDEEKKNCVTKQDNMGKTALHVAAMKGLEGPSYSFHKRNEDIIQIKDADGRIALFEAVKGGHDDLCSSLLYWNKKYNIADSIVDRSGLTLLHVASSEGRASTADLLLKESEKPEAYVSSTDVFGQTALHKAAKGGHADVIKVLLHWGAHPLLARDCDGRTVFHYFAQSQLTGEDGIKVAELLLTKCGSAEKKLLLLWASAAGLGTADQHLSNSPLRDFLLQQKKHFTETVAKENNLLRIAACLGDVEMTKELLTRGAQIGDIKDKIWRKTLTKEDEVHNVDTVCKQIESIAEQGNDTPTTSDNLGRSDFAHGLAALLLNPYLKPPITVGISGSWGKGKSSLMVQTEGVLLKTAAQLALLPSEMPSSKMTSSSFPGFQILEHTEKGRKKYHQIQTSIDLLLNDSKFNDAKLKSNFFQILKNKIVECWRKIKCTVQDKTRKEGDSLLTFLNDYEAKHYHIFKSLAAMDSRGMFIVKGQQSEPEIDVPAILTVRYNAWRYKNESEALAGMAVEITKGMEGIMTDAQWLSTCLRNTWRKQKQAILIEIIFPYLLAILLATSFTWVLWLLLDDYKIRQSKELKYASFPLTVVIMVWTLVKKVMSTVHPVSTQLMNYIKLPDHTSNLGYQERVIDDITFLKKEISRNPYFLCTAASYIWDFITGSCIISLSSSRYSGENIASLMPSANLRTIVFVDDLDRCQESVILQVLSAINLVLAVCEISVVLGMDKGLIQRAILKRHGDKSLKDSKLADKYLQKIMQLPLDLPDPSQDQSTNFLHRHLGVFQNQSTEGLSHSEGDSVVVPEIDAAYNALFSPLDRSDGFLSADDLQKILGSVTPISEANNSAETKDATSQRNPAEGIAIDIQGVDGASGQRTSDSNVIIPMRELLFVRYSEGERETFCHFQRMATDIRKLPREWKRLLNYHRLVWYIFIINNETKDLDGWQVQLITWIFICWEFEDNMNILVKRWNEIDLLKTYKRESKSSSESGPMGPSLRAIVEHCIKKESWIIASSKGEKIAATSNGRDTNKDPPTEKSEDVKEKNGRDSENIEVPESSNIELPKLKEGVMNGGDCPESSGVAGPEDLIKVVKEKNDKLEKSLLMELDALKKALRNEIKGEMKEQLDALRNEINLLKEQVESQEVRKSEKRLEENKLKLRSWGRLKSALEKYDVSMAGIQAFQRFRFYCEAGDLPWPLHSEE